MKRIAAIITIAILFVALSSLVAYKNHLETEAEFEARLSAAQLVMARHIGHSVEQLADSIKQGMTISSLIPSIRKGDNRCRAHMEEIYEGLRGGVRYLYRLNEKGRVTHVVPEGRMREVEERGRALNPLITAPLSDDGRPEGVIGAEIDLSYLVERETRPGMLLTSMNGYAWAIDDLGRFIFHPEDEFVGRDAFSVRKERAPEISFEAVNRIMREKMMKGESGADTYVSGWHRERREEIRKLIAYSPFRIGFGRYSLALVTPASEVAALTRRNFRNTLTTIAVVTLLMLSGLLFVLRIERGRIEALKREAGLAEEIKGSRDYLQNLLESANDFIYTVDINGHFTYLNSRVEDYGYRADELLGKPFLTILTEKHRGERFKKTIREKVRQTYPVELRTKDGAIRICRISASPLMAQDGGVAGLLATVRDITEREQAKADLLYFKEYNEKIVASIPASLLVLDRNLNIKSVNRAYRETRGIKDEDVVGKNIKEVFPGQLLKEGGILEAFEEVMATKEPRSLYEVKHASSDHQEKILNITVSGLRRAEEEEEEEEELILVIEDITERARMREEIRKSRDFMDTIFKTSVDMVVTTDERGIITFVNRAMERIAGYKEEELTGRHVSVLYDRGRERAKDMMGILTSGQALKNYRLGLLAKQGKEIPVSISGSLLKDGQGRVIGTLGFVRDVSRLVEAEDELREKNKELENFVYIVSHDLKSPIVSMQGFSAMLLNEYREKLGDEGGRYLERIRANASRMEVLISDLLALSRVGRVVGAFKAVSSLDIVNRVCNGLKSRLEENRIGVFIGDNLPTIHCDGDRIYQVFENLIVNAVKFMGDAKEPRIEIGYDDMERFHRFYVRDNGIGIDPKYHRKIFEIFQRLNEIEDEEGTGIGLVIVERIVKNHGGKVWVESEKGEGATFYFTLPAQNGHAA